VDPDGRLIVVGGTIYIPGPCPDRIQNAGDKLIWNTLNALNDTRLGEMLISDLNKKDGYVVNIKYGVPAQANAVADYEKSPSMEGYGEVNLNEDEIAKHDKALVGIIAHELFHGYQDKYGRGQLSVNNELEARLFEFGVTGDYLGCDPRRGSLFGRADYSTALYDVLFNETFNQDDYNKVLNGFQTFAQIGGTYPYNTYDIRGKNQESTLIEKFYPLRK